MLQKHFSQFDNPCSINFGNQYWWCRRKHITSLTAIVISDHICLQSIFIFWKKECLFFDDLFRIKQGSGEVTCILIIENRCPTDLAVLSCSPAWGEIFSTVNGVSLHTVFHYHPSIVLMWLKYCWKGRKIANHPSIGNRCNKMVYEENFLHQQSLISHQDLWPTGMKRKSSYKVKQTGYTSPLDLTIIF